MAQLIDRRGLKAHMKALVAGAQVSPKAMAALYMALLLILNLASSFSGDAGLLTTFISILSSLMALILHAGFALYCMAIRRGERSEFLTLFDGFAFVGKIISLNIIMFAFIYLWSMLFVVPGIIASYRYRFALFNLYENPGISVMEALNMSKRQTTGYKIQLLQLDLSYLGWTLLSMIPTLIYNSSFSVQLVQSTLGSSDIGLLSTASLAAPFAASFPSLASALPLWGWTLVMGLWQLVVSIFYYPTYQCVELEYFEISKRTSGIGMGAGPRPNDGYRNGPDSMGGF